MASWAGWGGKGGGPGNSGVSRNASKPKKKERWLVTRKTWRYMADAGKLLIPEALRMGKDPRNYTEDDINLLEEHFQNVSEQQPEFIIWEGPLEDPRYALAKSRKAPSLSSESQDQSETTDSDYRYESHSAKFRIVLPPGSKPPSGYVQVGTRRLPLCDIPSVHHPDSFLRLSSGMLVQELPAEILQDADWSFSGSEINSPIDSGILSPECMFSPNREFTPDYDDCKADTRESGLGSGADSVVFTNKISVSCQTDPLPPEFVHIQQGELKALEELRQKKEEEDRIAQESEALARREARRSSEDYDSAAMGETVMKYLKMVRRNSKSADMKKAERFRNMNYDPTLRNIRPKYVHNESTLNSTQHIGIQCGESLVKILKMCHTPVEPQRDKTKRRKFSLTPSDSSLYSPRYSITIADDSIPPEVERDFFSQLYGGDTPVDAGNIPEEYYSYLENWYRSQVSAHITQADPRTGSAPALHTALSSPFSLQQVSSGPTSSLPSPSVSSPSSSLSSSVYIPVSALQSLRASLPAQLPQISVMRTTGHTTNKISKTLWKGRRSKSQSRAAPQISSPWTPPALDSSKETSEWSHVSGQAVALQSSTLLHLLEIERVFLQKQAQAALTSAELGTIVRIPKDICDRGEISKTRKSANLLKKRIAGNIVGKREKDRDFKTKGGEGLVFGVPINQTVEANRKRSTTDIPSEDILSPTSKSSRSDSRSSFDLSPLHPAGSYDSLEGGSIRRSSWGSVTLHSPDTLSGLSYPSCDRLIETGDPSERINPQPCVPSVVTTCIKYLELHGLNTVGIFRVSPSAKRVKKLRENFNSGAEVILTEEVSVHDVASILKEFFKDLPEPLLPREVYHPLLAIQKIRNRKQQIDAMRRVVQLLPQVNRDTLYVLLNFLHLVAENSEDRKGASGEDLVGNKMDSNNLATLFAPNILHSMKTGDGTMSPENSAKAAERTETINIVRMLIDFNKELFELNSEELHQLYLKMHDDVPEAMDYLLRRRALLNGDEFLDEFESSVIYDMPEPRLIGPNMEPSGYDVSQERKVCHRSVSIPPILEGDTDAWDEEEDSLDLENKKLSRKRLRKKEDDGRGRTRRRGSEAESSEKSGSWFKFRDKSDQSEPGEQSRWFKRRDKSVSTTESLSCPPARGSKKDGKGVVTGSLRINVSGLQGEKTLAGGPEVDIPYIEDTSSTKPKQMSKRVVLRRLSQDSDGKMLSCEIHLPSMKTSTMATPGTDSLIYSPSGSYRGASPSDVFTYNVISGSNSSRGSGVSSPSQPISPPPTLATPMIFSPPASPFSLTPTPQHHQDMNISVETRYLEPGGPGGGPGGGSGGGPGPGAHDVSLVLKPVPSPTTRRPSPAESTKTLVNEPCPEISVSSEEKLNKKRGSPGPWQLRTIRDSNLAMSSLSLPSEKDNTNRLSANNPEMRSKTDNLDMLITEVERQVAASNDQGGSSTSLGNREVKKYIRRRYTDSRHPTTELPDVRGAMTELPSVRDPPVRNKSKSKEMLEEGADTEAGGEKEQKRSPCISSRPSYQRWQHNSNRTGTP